ncbi:hypothetical protein Tco_0212561 [Tanacetum coccineum]
MRTRSQTRNRNRQQQSQQAVVQPFHLEEPFVNPPLVSMADNRTMAQLLQAPTEGYEDAIVIPEIKNNFKLKQTLINLVQKCFRFAAVGNFLDKMPRDGLAIIESKSKVRYSRSRAIEPRFVTQAIHSNPRNEAQGNVPNEVVPHHDGPLIPRGDGKEPEVTKDKELPSSETPTHFRS